MEIREIIRFFWVVERWSKIIENDGQEAKQRLIFMIKVIT